MRLAKPFVRLPVRFDVERLRIELAAVPDEAWAPHPNRIAGNSSLRLISVNGGENDDVDGAMRATGHLERMPYVRQILAAFGVVWSRSRLLRLAPGADVPEHADINYHWFNRVRVHLPIVTQPEVTFHCGGESVHMQAGDAWIFDNWRLHRVENRSPHTRVHLVADTAGSSEFWKFAATQGQPDREHTYEPAENARPLTERATLRPVMVPAEVEFLILDLRSELVAASEGIPAAQLTRYHTVLDAFARDWRQVYALHGEDPAGRAEFVRLRDQLRASSREAGEGLMMRTNRVAAHSVLEGRVLRVVVSETGAARVRAPKPRPALDRPVFIVAAPRSGSTLLFETLAVSDSIATLGGEGHWMIEGIEELRPGAPGVESNRLLGAQATEPVVNQMLEFIAAQRRAARDVAPDLLARLRFLEKTPKNVLRVPFLRAAFPDARFIFLWRDPRESLASIIEAWMSGRWVTYNGLDGKDQPWSLLLPPGWREMRDRPLADIAAFQWESANRIALEDLAQLPREAWTVVNYAEFLTDPATTIARLCAFMRIEVDAALRARTAASLPYSRQTHTPPSAEKWLKHRDAIERVIKPLDNLHARLKALRD